MNIPFPWIRWTLFLSLATAPLVAETVDYEYDTAGRLIGVRHAGGLRIHYLYDAAGNLLVRRYQSPVDTDQDGMDDAWEMVYFTTLARDGAGDLDGDGADSDEIGHRFRFYPDRVPADVGQRSGVCRTLSRSEATLRLVSYSVGIRPSRLPGELFQRPELPRRQSWARRPVPNGGSAAAGRSVAGDSSRPAA